jgi:hypothetical protein
MYRGRGLTVNRLCTPGSELAVDEHWYPATALDDLLEIEDDGNRGSMERFP